ncbi:MAG: SRPBCC domain-containing protein [Planctomycetes bacterium]|nr:SRPBCC domain-containing protein [Planctomycetota bacterium]
MTRHSHLLTRTLVIAAPRELVFRYFTDSERFARWWGPGSTVDARVGGAVCIVYPNQVVARGEFTRLETDRAVAFTYGYEDPAKPIAIGGSLVTIELEDHARGTRLSLRHELADEQARDQHVPGWRFQLSQFANVVGDEQHAGCEATIDEWFAAWHESDAEARSALLLACCTDDVVMQDRYASLAGRDELDQHIAACLLHMPGTVMRRDGDVKHCQGSVLVEWTASDAGGASRGKGTNVMRLAADGRISWVVGFW